MERKRLWKQFIKSTYGRKDDVLSSGLTALTLKQNHGKDDGTSGVSEFDPVLAEILLAWFCPKSGRVIDCFAGGSVRGLVSAFTGRKYSGMDLRQEQINANEENWNAVQNEKDFYGNTLEHPEWICGDLYAYHLQGYRKKRLQDMFERFMSIINLPPTVSGSVDGTSMIEFLEKEYGIDFDRIKLKTETEKEYLERVMK